MVTKSKPGEGDRGPRRGRRVKGPRVVLGLAAVTLLAGGIGAWMAWQGSRTETRKGDAGLITRIELVELVELKKEPCLLALSSESDAKYVIKYEDIHTGQRRRLRTPYIPAGDGQESVFFRDPPLQGKFRLVGVEMRAVKNERIGITREEQVATVEVLKGPKKGTRYEIARSNKRFIVRDYKAVLVFNAPGEGGQQFEVAENDTFSLPYDSEAAKKPYRFKGVDDSGRVIIEWQTDGKTSTRILTPSS